MHNVTIVVGETHDHRARVLADALQALAYPDYLPDGTAESPPTVTISIRDADRARVQGRVREATVRYERDNVVVKLLLES
jgi:hypothetical protein